MNNVLVDNTGNQYPFGGMFPIYIPAAIEGAGKWLRDRMYRTVKPEGYNMEQIKNFIEGNSRGTYGGPNVEALFGKYIGQDSIIADDTQSPDYMPSGLGRRLTDKERKALGVDNSSLRKYAVGDIIIPSKSKESVFEFAYPNRLGSVPHLPFDANKVPDESWPHSHELGIFHQMKDKDENGTYVTYEDIWDINPFRGVSSNDDSTPIWQSVINAGKAVGLDKVGDMVPFGKPFEMHGKQYYNERGYPKKKSEGGFLHQPKDAWDALPLSEKSEMMKVAVRNGITDLKTIREKYNEFAEGGKAEIHIKPENRGKFTALKERTGHSATWFKEHGTPAQKKMAVFALNSRKWKHGLGGNLFDGTSEGTQQMQIGRPFWQSQTQQPSFMESLAEFNRQQEIKKQQQRQALREKINTVGKRLAKERMREASIESNDNAWVEIPLLTRKKNSYLSRRAEEGAKAHAAWEKEHPNLTAWGNLAGAVPFAVASVPLGAGIIAGGDALAATTAGQAVTSGLAPVYQAAIGASVAGAPALAWANTGLQSLMASHGLSEAANGIFTPTTALELTPLAPGIVRTPGIINNLRPQNIRNHWYVAKPPIGYDGIGDAVGRWVRGVASGRPANIDNPWWFNNNSAKQLQDYAYVPEAVQGIEREQYLQQFGEHALEARTDAWRMHNLIPQKYNTFTPNPRHPGSFTDVEGIRRLKYIPPQTEGTPQVDFVNSVGGNVGVPEITNLGNGIPDAGTQIKRFGVTTTSDWFDLHPFSREGDRLIPRFVKPLWDKHIAAPILNDAKWMKRMADRFKYNDAEIKTYLAQNKDNEWAMEMFDPDMFPATRGRRKIGDAFETLSNSFKKAARTPEFNFLKPLEDKMANLEAGDITGGKPFLVQYDIPFTTNIRFTSKAPGVVTEQVPGFVSENLLPQSVFNWKHGIATESANINLENNFDFLNKTLTRKSKR